MYSELSTGTRILPSRSARYRASIAAVSPKVEVTEAWRNRLEGPTRLLPAQKVDCLRSPLSIVNERKKPTFGRNRDGRGFAVTEGWRAGGEIGEERVLLVRHVAERRISSGD